MKKRRFQPTFASLTEAELEQLAEAVQRETYDAVRKRICKPRSEGGLDLHFTSDSPLVRLRDKKDRLDIINARLCAECAHGKKLSLADLNTFTSGEHRAPEEVHDAIMSATYILVTEQDNTPHQLLALQRLADFPARSAQRDQMAELRAAKAQREAEMHTHKINLDLRKFDHKLQMDTFHQNIATERLDLQKKSLALRENPCNADNLSAPSRDVIGSTDTASADLTSTNAEKPSASADPNSELKTKNSTLAERFPTPNPLPHDIYLKNCAYTEKLLAGLVDPLTGRVLDEPTAPSPAEGTSPTSRTSISGDAITPTDAAPAAPNPQSNPANPVNPVQNPQQTPIPSIPFKSQINPESSVASPLKSQISNSEFPSELHLETRNQKLENPLETSPSSPHSEHSTSACNTQAPNRTEVDSALRTQDSALSSIVDRYTIRRAQEYWSHRRLHSDPPRPRQTTSEYITAYRHCPCGQGTASNPCPIHESEEFGPFPNYFWKLSPHSVEYAAALRERNLPYRNPTEFL